MTLPVGTRIGPYEIATWIGAGGMGEVYSAYDARLGREVAIKLISERFASDPSRVHRFEQEARAAGQINHPNILAVYDVGRHDGTPYIVSELLEGESLARRLKDGALSTRKVIDYAGQIAAGLAAAHDKNLVHRDLKPDNLFITTEGRVKILDFGIAKLTTPADAPPQTGFPTETAEGVVIGTIGYMSPEQLRGESVDARSDLFSFGTVVHEMLTGQPAFLRDTGAETIAAILKEDPPAALPESVPPALARIVGRCLEKTRDARFQSARDLGFALAFLSGSTTSAPPVNVATPPRSSLPLAALAIIVLGVVAAVASWLGRSSSTTSVDNPLANAVITHLTNWEGNEEGAEISPDGRLVAFLSDSAGEFDIWVTQLGTGHFVNLTENHPPLAASGAIVRKLGFSSDNSEIWFNPGDTRQLMRMPWSGGPPRAFLIEGANTPAWSPDGRVVYVFKPNRDDPIYLTDSSTADPKPILGPAGLKNLNPVWSPDGEWIYFTRGLEPQDETEMDVWRLRPSGGSPEQVTQQHLAVNFLAPLDPRRLLYVARAEDRSGPWLWMLDVASRRSTRMPSGVDQYTSVSTSRDGKRVVATVSNPSGSLWRVPLREQLVREGDAERYPLPVLTGLPMAPRFGGNSLFFLSTRGARDGLWKLHDGKLSEVYGVLSEPPAVSPNGRQLAVVIRREGKRHLSIMSADGTNPQTLAPSIEIEGAAGQGAADWSPDGTRIVTGGRDAKGPALFVIPVAAGEPIRLKEGNWVNPIWSKDDMIVFAGRSVVGQVALQAMRSDGTPIDLPEVMVRPGGYRFVPDGRGVVFLPRIQGLDFWFFDVVTKRTWPLTSLSNQGAIRTFDITPDQRHIVFDRQRQNSNVVLFDLSK